MGLMKKLTAAIATSSLLVTMVGTAFAAYTPSNAQASCDRMMSLQILKGKYADNACALNDEITRAELATIVVRAFGQEDNAALLNGAAAFPDTANHWASGYIAIAKNLIEKQGDTVGMPDGTFQPDKKLSPAEAVAFLMKFLGQKPDNTKAWPDNYLSRAVEINLITKADADTIAPMLNDNATRGLVFALYDNAYSKFDLGGGKTFYTKYVDTVAPVLTLDTLEATTLADKVTVTGKVEGASELYVGTEKATIGANGSFSQDVALTEFGEKTITVVAKDVAGNSTTKTLTVTRTVGAVASIEASAITVAAGATVDVAAVAKDQAGNTIADAAVTGTSTVGTFADGKFTAGTAAGTGTLTLTAGEKSVDVNVTVTAADIAKVVSSVASAKVGERVTLSAQDEFGNKVSGATYTVDNNTDVLLDGVQGVMIASKAGTYTVTGTANGKTATATVGVYSGTVTDLVIAGPTSVVGNSDLAWNAGTSKFDGAKGSKYQVTVKAVDANGNVVGNYDGSITLGQPNPAIILADKDGNPVNDATVSAKAVNGVATFNFYANIDLTGRQINFAYAQTGTGADQVGDDAATSDNVTKATVEIAEQVATKVVVNTDSTAKYLRANDDSDSTTVSVYVADQNGKRFLDTIGYNVNLSVSGSAVITAGDFTRKTSGTVIYNGSAAQTVKFESIKGVTGDATLTASVDGLGTATAKVTAAIAQAAKNITLTADMTTAVAADVDTVEYNVVVTDANGVPVSGDYAIKGEVNTESKDELTVTDGGATTYTLTKGTGKSTFTFTAVNGKATLDLQAYKFTGDLKLTLSDNGDKGLTSANTTVTFKADSAAYAALTRTTNINVAYAAPTATVTAQLYDAAGNKSTASGVVVTFTGNSDDVTVNGTKKTADVETDANGVATANVSVLGYVDEAYTITITSDDLDSDTFVGGVDAAKDQVSLTVVNAIATKTSVTLKDDAGNVVTRVKAGEAVHVVVKVTDAAGRAVKGDTLYFVPASAAYETSADALAGTNAISKTDGVQIDEVLDAVTNLPTGTYELVVYPTTASSSFSYTIKDKTPGTELAQTGSFRVVANVADQLVINGGDDIGVTKNTASGAITLTLTDAYGNAVAASNKLTVTFDAGGDAVGIRTAVSAPDAASLTINAGATSTTFYVWNVLSAGTYTVDFSAVDGATTYAGSADIVVSE